MPTSLPLALVVEIESAMRKLRSLSSSPDIDNRSPAWEFSYVEVNKARNSTQSTSCQMIAFCLFLILFNAISAAFNSAPGNQQTPSASSACFSTLQKRVYLLRMEDADFAFVVLHGNQSA